MEMLCYNACSNQATILHDQMNASKRYRKAVSWSLRNVVTVLIATPRTEVMLHDFVLWLNARMHSIQQWLMLFVWSRTLLTVSQSRSSQIFHLSSLHWRVSCLMYFWKVSKEMYRLARNLVSLKIHQRRITNKKSGRVLSLVPCRVILGHCSLPSPS